MEACMDVMAAAGHLMKRIAPRYRATQMTATAPEVTRPSDAPVSPADDNISYRPFAT